MEAAPPGAADTRAEYVDHFSQAEWVNFRKRRRTYAAAVGISVAPHDLRRSYAHLAYSGHAPLEQIQFSLGHASVVTTELYLGARQNLRDAPCDHLGLCEQHGQTGTE